MGKIANYFVFFLIFFFVNLHIGIQIPALFEEFKNKTGFFSIDVIGDVPPGQVIPMDIDDDGNDECVSIKNPIAPEKLEITIFEPIRTQNSIKFLPDSNAKIELPYNSQLFDIFFDRENKKYVFQYLENLNGDLVLRRIDKNNRELQTIKCDSFENKLPEKSVGLSFPEFVDLDSDGNKEMLIIYQSYYLHSHRGIACCDAESGKMRWSFFTGALIKEMKIHDLDRNGRKEIVLSTTAVNNGAERNGTSDAFSYVMVLDNSGKELWKTKTGEWYTSAQSTIFDTDNDGTAEIITATECHRVKAKEKSALYIFNALKDKKKFSVTFPNVSLTTPFACKTLDGDTRIYVGDSLGRLFMFDKDLNPIKTVETGSPVIILEVKSQPGEPGYVLARTANTLIAYDLELDHTILDYTLEHPLDKHNYDFIFGSTFTPLHRDDNHKAIIIADRMYMMSEEGNSISRIIAGSISSGLLPALLLLVLFNGFLFYSLYLFEKKGFLNRQPSKGENRLKFLEMIQDIAQQLKNPISNVMWTAEKIKRNIETHGIHQDGNAETYSQLSDFLMEDVKTLRLQTHQVLKLIHIQEPRFDEVKLKPLLLRMVEHYRALMDKKIEIRLDMDEDISIIIDAELFKEAVAKWVDLALENMQDEGIVAISVFPVKSFFSKRIKDVSIIIEDNNPHTGTEKEEEPGSKALGLFICKQIIHVHGGKIRVRKQMGPGTRVSITIPYKQGSRGKEK